MSETIFVTAELKMNADKPRQQVVEAIEQFCLDMQSEAGCLQANATYDSTEPQRVILWERYENRTAIEAHFAMPHTQAFIAAEVAELVQAFEIQAQ
ncbi:antibiotic biosynthesis monooxygenase [Vibrio alginolyticus]|uniref:putative quinol monooxygenase n=1 Tax=Vibrio alginolyticus TaxID=663 RepID=UPI00197FAE28|nr:antibiotic biosynthesis monooxygenase [Vibrio alginolyticus]QSI81223.1 antibiotic biosynthesis monooxygenase [Vibrio alginolyticus]URR27237.1 antibiotic biosynthesis monooxygenase [Vibrio alginolyticus]